MGLVCSVRDGREGVFKGIVIRNGFDNGRPYPNFSSTPASVPAAHVTACKSTTKRCVNLETYATFTSRV